MYCFSSAEVVFSFFKKNQVKTGDLLFYVFRMLRGTPMNPKLLATERILQNKNLTTYSLFGVAAKHAADIITHICGLWRVEGRS